MHTGHMIWCKHKFKNGQSNRARAIGKMTITVDLFDSFSKIFKIVNHRFICLIKICCRHESVLPCGYQILFSNTKIPFCLITEIATLMRNPYLIAVKFNFPRRRIQMSRIIYLQTNTNCVSLIWQNWSKPMCSW